jgi:hypothetical protein
MRRILPILAAALLAAPAGAHATGCFTFTDAAGDTGLQQLGVADAEPGLDVVGVEYLTTATSIGARIEVAQLGATPLKAPGDVFQAGFTHAGFYWDIYAERLAGTVVRGSSSPSGLTVTATFDPATSSVTVLAPKSEIETATGDSLTNARLHDLNAGASAHYGSWVLYDDAYPDPGTTYAVGSTC